MPILRACSSTQKRGPAILGRDCALGQVVASLTMKMEFRAYFGNYLWQGLTSCPEELEANEEQCL